MAEQGARWLAVAGLGVAFAVTVTVAGVRTDSLLRASTAPATHWEGEAPGSFRIDSVTTAQNRLVVGLTNEHGASIRGDLAITVNGGRPALIHATQLSATGNASIPLDGVVVQRRSRVELEVRSADGRSSRTLSAIVAPDARNDLELASAHVDADGMLVAEVRNNSPIPLRGIVAVAAREPAFPYTLLARIDAALEVEPGGVQHVRVGRVGSIDVDRTWIGLTTDAIEDADIGNDVLNRS